MTRAIHALLSYLYETRGVNHVSLGIEPENTRSIAIAERLGFTRECIRRDGWFRDGHFVDVAVYALLAKDWDERASK